MIIDWYNYTSDSNSPKKFPYTRYIMSCCGATYSRPQKSKPRSSDMGIRVFDGIHWEEQTDPFIIKNISTRNGDITAIIKKVKEAKNVG